MCSACRGKVILGYTETELCRRGSGYQFVHAADMMYCAENHVKSECQGEQPGGGHRGCGVSTGVMLVQPLPSCYCRDICPGSGVAVVKVFWVKSAQAAGPPVQGHLAATQQRVLAVSYAFCLRSMGARGCSAWCRTCDIPAPQSDQLTASVPPLFSPCPSDEDRGERADGLQAADQEGCLGVGPGQCPAGVQRGSARLHHRPAASPLVSMAGFPAAFACPWHRRWWGCSRGQESNGSREAVTASCLPGVSCGHAALP